MDSWESGAQNWTEGIEEEFTAGKYTFTTKTAMRSFNFTEPLSSGLLGPVTILENNL